MGEAGSYGEKTIAETEQVYSKTSINRPTVGAALSGQFMGVGRFREIEYLYGRSFGSKKRDRQASGRSVAVLG